MRSPPTRAYVVPAVGEKRFTVAAIDLGIKAMTPAMMAERGIEVHVLPATATLDDVLRGAAGRALLLQRPRRPGRHTQQVELLKGALERGLPYFGICFGNQLFGRALGLGTYKLKYGHRGINQPVMDRTTGKVEVTAHNHGFAVGGPKAGRWTRASRRPTARRRSATSASTTTSSRGSSCATQAGELAAFSVQYHPEAAAGPHDAAYLFDRFCRDSMDREGPDAEARRTSRA